MFVALFALELPLLFTLQTFEADPDAATRSHQLARVVSRNRALFYRLGDVYLA